jgi:hypothetical protein
MGVAFEKKIRGSRFDSATTILGYIYWDRTGGAGLASFLGLVGPVLGASALPGRASMVPGGAKPVLGIP